MTRTVGVVKKQPKRTSAIPRFGSKIKKTKTSPISAVVRSTLQGRTSNHLKKPQTKSVRFAGVRDTSFKDLPKSKEEACRSTGFPINNNQIADDFVFESDPDALASILNNDGVTREQLIKAQAAEAAKEERSADEFLLVDGRPSLCRRVPIKRASAVLPDGRPSLLSTRVSAGPARIERPSVSGRTSFMKKGSAAPLLGRDSLYAFIEQKYSQRFQHPDLEHTQRRTTIASTASQNFNHGGKSTQLKDRTNKMELFEPQRVMSTKKKAPATPASRILVATNPVLGSPALRVRQSDKKTDAKSRLALVGSPAMKGDVVAALNFHDDENISPNVRSKVNQCKKNNKPAKSLPRLQPPTQLSRRGMSGIKPPEGAAAKSKLPPRNSDRYSFLKKQPSNGTKDTKLHARFAPVNLKKGEELVKPKTLNEQKQPIVKSPSKPEQAMHVKVCSPMVLNDEPKLENSGTKPRSTSTDINDNAISHPPTINNTKMRLKSPKGYLAPSSRVSAKKFTLDADTVLEMMKRKLKTIKRRSVQNEFCSVMKSMEKEMSLASVAENPEVGDTDNIVEDSSQSGGQAQQNEEADLVASPPAVHEKSWHDILKSDESPTWKTILKQESQTKADKQSSADGLDDTSNHKKMPEKIVTSPVWKDILKKDMGTKNSLSVTHGPSASESSSAENSVKILGNSRNLRRLLGTESNRDPVASFKGQDYNSGAGLGVTKDRFLNILRYNLTPSVKQNPVFTVNKFFDPVSLNTPDKKPNSFKETESKMSKNESAVFKSQTSEGSKFFLDFTPNMQEACGSEKSTTNVMLPNIPRSSPLLNTAQSTTIASINSIGDAATNSVCSTVDDDVNGSEGMSCTRKNINALETAKNHELFSTSKEEHGNNPDESNQTAIRHSVKTTHQLDKEDTSFLTASEAFKDNQLDVGATLPPVQWVEKTPNVNRCRVNCHVMLNPVESPKSPEADIARSAFWVENTPVSQFSDMPKKISPDLGMSHSHGTHTASSSMKHNECSRIAYSANVKPCNGQSGISYAGDTMISQHDTDLHEPCKPSQGLKSPEMVNSLHKEFMSPNTNSATVPVANAERRTSDQNASPSDKNQPKIFDGVSWSEKYGLSKHKISSGRLGKDTNTKMQEKCNIDQETVPIVRVVSPKVASPHTSITSVANEYSKPTTLSNSRELQLTSKNAQSNHDSESSRVTQHSKDISSQTTGESPTFQRKVRFSDAVTHIDCLQSNNVASESFLEATNEVSCAPREKCSELAQTLGKKEPVSVKLPSHEADEFNSANLDLSFLDSLHVVAIETKKDAIAKRSMLPKPCPPKPLSEKQPSALPLTLFTGDNTQSAPCTAVDRSMAAKHMMPMCSVDNNSHQVMSTSPGCEHPKTSSSYVIDEFSLSKTKALMLEEEEALSHVIAANPQPLEAAKPDQASPSNIFSTMKSVCPTNLKAPSSHAVQNNLHPIERGNHWMNVLNHENKVDSGEDLSVASNSDEEVSSDSGKKDMLQQSHLITNLAVKQKISLVANDDNWCKTPPCLGERASYLCPTRDLLDDYISEDRNLSNVEKCAESSRGRDHHDADGEGSVSGILSPISVLPDFVKQDRSVFTNSRVNPAINVSLTAATGSNVFEASDQVLKPTPMKLLGCSHDESDVFARSSKMDLKSPISVVAPKPIFPPAPQTPAAFRQLRRKLQESPIPKSFRSRCSSMKSAFGGVRKTPQKKVRFMSASPYMKSLCSKRFTEALLDEEVALLTCRRFRSPGTPSKKTRSRVAHNPLGRVLLDGDDSHFVPISPMDGNKKAQSATGSAFSVFKQ